MTGAAPPTGSRQISDGGSGVSYRTGSGSRHGGVRARTCVGAATGTGCSLVKAADATDLFGLAMRHDGIDALITLSVAAGLGAVERSRLEAAVLALDGIDLIALVEPVTGSGRPATPVAITVRDGDYELRVLSRTEPARANVVPGMQLMARARLLQ